MNAYLIIDIGTGNVRVALIRADGVIMQVERDNIIYKKDGKYEDALFFDPDYLWEQVLKLIRKIIMGNRNQRIIAITASSQREGIVLIDQSGKSIIGFPNHDQRGRFMESIIKDKEAVYKLAGRFPTSLFSALKLVAYREKYAKEWELVDCFMSISDWAQFQLTGVKCYEHSQASETLLYDVERKCWSDTLFELFNLEKNIAPPLYFSGSKLGCVKEGLSEKCLLDAGIPVFVGGADTQLAIKSTCPESDDIIIVSGTTTPVVKVSAAYILDDQKRSWTNSHLNKEQYILETNCGVTGLNYQRIKALFYPNESYESIEEELDYIKEPAIVACLGSLLADDKNIITHGGYLFNVPIMTELSRADFAFATLWDIACSIKENFDCLLNITSYNKDYVWCCGGGLQSKHLRQFIAGLINKKIKFRQGYHQASVMGGALICGEAVGGTKELNTAIEITDPEDGERYNFLYNKWRNAREKFKVIS